MVCSERLENARYLAFLAEGPGGAGKRGVKPQT
jgi:hypothetical protein